jgi:hypothetical protein
MGSSGAFLLVGAVFVFSLLLILFVFVVVFLMWRLLGNAGGWPRLAARYPATRPPQGQVLSWQTVRIGAVRYRFIAQLAIEPGGLYLATRSVAPFVKNPPAFIPWSAFTHVEKSLLYWGSARKLTVGQPPLGTITVWNNLFDQMRPYLDPTITQGM